MNAAIRFIARTAAAVAFALGLFALYCFVASRDPWGALVAFAVGPFASLSAVLTLAERAAPLALCAAGVAVAFRTGLFNLGGEGQAYAGAFTAFWAATALGAAAPSPLVALAFGAAGGVLVALPSAIGRVARGADVLLSTFLVAQAIVPLVDWAIAAPFRDASSNLVATAALPDAFLVGRLIPPSAFTAAFPAAFAFTLVLSVFLRRTRAGFSLRMYGRNPVFAASVGLPAVGAPLGALLASGAIHGLAGALLVVTGDGRAVRGMTGGVGWNGIGVALLAGLEPAYCVPAAVFFAWLDAGARTASIVSDLSYDAGAALKALILLLVTVKTAPALLARILVIGKARVDGPGRER